MRFALRTFRRSPAFVLTVVLTIALALGLNTSVFTIFNAYVLRPLTLRDGASLYELAFPRRLTWREYQELRALPIASEGFAYDAVVARSDTRPLLGSIVTGDALQVLGAVPALGRMLLPEDASPPSGAPVVVLSHDAWTGKFGSDSAIIGKTIRVRGIALTVVGVAAPRFTGIGSVPPDFWAPITLLSGLSGVDDLFGPKEPAVVRPVIRLRPGVDERQARAALLAWGARETALLPDSVRWRRVDLVSLESAMPLSNDVIAIFAPAAVAFGLVLLIACVNVANVMLARGIARHREIGIRLALGASRARLVRQLLAESMLLAIPAAALGLAISMWAVNAGVRILFASAPEELAPYLRTIPLSPDLRVFGFLVCAAFGSAIVFGLMPALQATRPNLVRASRGEFNAGPRVGRIRGALVVIQIGFCSLLLIVTGVLLRGASAAKAIPTGIRTRNVVELSLDDRRRDKSVRQLRSLPVITHLGASAQSPLDGIYPAMGVRPDDERRVEVAGVDFVDAGFFRVLDIPILRGRAFTADEERVTEAVAIVSQSTARTLWPGRDPIGQTVHLTASASRSSRLDRVRVARVVGVAGDAVSGGLETGLSRPVVYYPVSIDSLGTRVLARTSDAAPVARQRVDAALAAVDERAAFEIRTLDAMLAEQHWPYLLFSWISLIVGAIALGLTIIGTYGVLSYLVAQRSREIGIRMALGARVGSVVGLVVRQSLRYAAIGLVAGTIAALGVSRLFASILFGVDTYDPAGYALGIAVVLLPCAVAAWAPSRRAAQVNPVEALRAE